MFICESDRSTSCFRKLERIAIRLSNAFQVLIKQLFPVINGLTRKDVRPSLSIAWLINFLNCLPQLAVLRNANSTLLR